MAFLVRELHKYPSSRSRLLLATIAAGLPVTKALVQAESPRSLQEATMTEHVTLVVLTGGLEGLEIALDEHKQYIIGRASECDIWLPRDPGPADLSRHHCQLNVTPEGVFVVDLGSLHGTYVNEELIGRRPADCSAEQADSGSSLVSLLQDGDQLRVGNTILRVVANSLQPA
jgi:pSer/pThr/pTyr-binding forkhead associated (FHA) protein